MGEKNKYDRSIGYGIKEIGEGIALAAFALSISSCIQTGMEEDTKRGCTEPTLTWHCKPYVKEILE